MGQIVDRSEIGPGEAVGAAGGTFIALQLPVVVGTSFAVGDVAFDCSVCPVGLARLVSINNKRPD